MEVVGGCSETSQKEKLNQQQETCLRKQTSIGINNYANYLKEKLFTINLENDFQLEISLNMKMSSIEIDEIEKNPIRSEGRNDQFFQLKSIKKGNPLGTIAIYYYCQYFFFFFLKEPMIIIPRRKIASFIQSGIKHEQACILVLVIMYYIFLSHPSK